MLQKYLSKLSFHNVLELMICLALIFSLQNEMCILFLQKSSNYFSHV